MGQIKKSVRPTWFSASVSKGASRTKWDILVGFHEIDTTDFVQLIYLLSICGWVFGINLLV